MIQRLQSIFLLIVVIISTVLLFVTFAEFPYGNELFMQDLICVTSTSQPGIPVASNYYIAVVDVAVALIALTSIFLFRNRKRQMFMGNLNMLLIVAMIVLMFYSAGKNTEELVPGITLPVKYQVGAWLPIGQIVFTWLANRFIKKDEELVRSADRIR
jgi:glucan phosphoethanolaminetransferase (alkaline phosphatase superfamily)